jgi:C4-dicarboxylate transporter
MFFNRNLALKIQLAYVVVLFVIIVMDIVHFVLQQATKIMEKQCHEHNLEIQVFVVHVPIFYSKTLKALKINYLVKKNSPSLYVHLFHHFLVLTHQYLDGGNSSVGLP